MKEEFDRLYMARMQEEAMNSMRMLAFTMLWAAAVGVGLLVWWLV